MLLDAPLIPDSGYVRFLAHNASGLMGLHFSLHADEALDARFKLRNVPAESLAGLLRQVRGPRKYALLNSRLHHPDHYAEGARMKSLLARLEALLDEGELHGVVAADAYFLKALGRAAPGLARNLEAAPSVNAMIDSAARLRAWLCVIEDAGFRLPRKINLDRALNRDLQRLAKTGEQCRKLLPDAALVLLANEGCLPHCPFKPAHDAHIALANMGAVPERTFELNNTLGCIDFLAGAPHLCLSSPIIRPEDAPRYRGIADGLKVCGRTLAGPGRLQRIVSAYLHGRFEGNLLELCDSLDWLAERFDLRNELLPQDYFEQVCNCSGDCSACGFCRRAFEAAAKPREALVRVFHPEGAAQ